MQKIKISIKHNKLFHCLGIGFQRETREHTRILEWTILDLWELLSNIDENRETVGDQIKGRNDYIWKNNVKTVASGDFKCK